MTNRRTGSTWRILRRYWDLDERGISVIATDEDIREELLLLIKAGLAGAESRRTSERVRAYMGRAVAKGVHFGRPPFGYRRVRVDEAIRWEQEPAEADLVREMFRLAVEENMGFKAVADRLSARGHLAREGRSFAAFTIQKILTNEALKGSLVYGKKPKKDNPQPELVTVEDFFPAILSTEEWERLQQRLAIRREAARGQSHASIYLLSGIARCGTCGGPMVGKKGSSYKGRRYPNYACSRAMHSRAACPTYNGHSQPKLEQAILEFLGQYTDPKRVRELITADRRRSTKKADGDLKRVRQRLDAIERDFLKHLDLLDRGVLSEGEFATANQARRSEKEALQGRETELAEVVLLDQHLASVIEETPVRVRSFLKDFQTMDVRWQKGRLQEILKAAHVHRDGRIELEFRR